MIAVRPLDEVAQGAVRVNESALAGVKRFVVRRGELFDRVGFLEGRFER